MDNLKTVCIFDPAIDIVRIPPGVLEEYALTRDLAKLAPYYMPGRKPVIFTVRRIPRSVMRRTVWTAAAEEDKLSRCFQYGVVYVQDLFNTDGSRVNWEPSGTIDTPDGPMTCLSEIDINSERFADAEIFEIGAVIWYHNHLPLAIKDGWRLPRMSVDTLANRTFRSVAASLTGAALNSSKPLDPVSPPKESTASASADTASQSATPTAATAAGSGI